MNCTWNEKLNALHDGELDSDARASVAAHVATCAECATELARTQRVARFVKAATFPSMSELGMARLRDKLNGRRTLRLAGWLTSAAALVMLTCGAALYAMQSPATHGGSSVAINTTGEETNSVLVNAVVPGSELATAAESVDPLALAVLRADVTRDDGRE